MKRDYIEFQDRSLPKAYLITFRCYDTWLHGDERGSVDRRYNRPGTPKIKPSTETINSKRGQMKQDAFRLGIKERRIVRVAIIEVCEIRGYGLFALNIRTDHVHLVVTNSAKPERMMDSFKAYSTKALRAAGLVTGEGKTWSRHGSRRYLWADDHIATAVDYVVNGQGGELPKFD